MTSIAEFVGKDMHRRATAVDSRVHVQEVPEVPGWSSTQKVTFPLWGVYDWKTELMKEYFLP